MGQKGDPSYDFLITEILLIIHVTIVLLNLSLLDILAILTKFEQPPSCKRRVVILSRSNEIHLIYIILLFGEIDSRPTQTLIQIIGHLINQLEYAFHQTRQHFAFPLEVRLIAWVKKRRINIQHKLGCPQVEGDFKIFAEV